MNNGSMEVTVELDENEEDGETVESAEAKGNAEDEGDDTDKNIFSLTSQFILTPSNSSCEILSNDLPADVEITYGKPKEFVNVETECPDLKVSLYCNGTTFGFQC